MTRSAIFRKVNRTMAKKGGLAKLIELERLVCKELERIGKVKEKEERIAAAKKGGLP